MMVNKKKRKGGKKNEERDMEDRDTDDDFCTDSNSHHSRHDKYVEMRGGDL